MYYNKDTEYYYLFVNFGECCEGIESTYNIRVGRSKSVTGPFKGYWGRKMLNRGGMTLIPAKQKTNKRIVGPGHAGIITLTTDEDSQDYFSFHFYDKENDGIGTLGVYELSWKKGWPAVHLDKPLVY